MPVDSSPNDTLVRTIPDRIGLFVFAVVIWSIAAWMFWLVEKFADGKTWWDFSIRLVLQDLIFAIAVFGCALIVHACCPNATQRSLEKAAARLHVVAWAIIGLVASTLVFVSVVLPVLIHFGIVAGC